MPSTQTIKRRIGSVKNTRQITKAMEMVAASKLRKAQEAALRTEEYAKTAQQLLSHLRQSGEAYRAPLYEERKVKTRLFLVLSSDRGLAGAYNSNVFKLLTQKLQESRKAGEKTLVLSVGRQAGNFAARLKDVTSIGTYTDAPDEPDVGYLLPVVNTAVERFLDGKTDAVDVIYTDFVSSVTQTPTSLQLLPAGFETVDVPESIRLAEFEPSAEEVLNTVTMRLLESQVLRALLAAKASEHAMRRMAMHNATDNASELIDDLTLEMNKARQASITQELAEITSGAEALE